MQITKRNGTLVPYSREKILKAIRKGFKSSGIAYHNEFWDAQVSIMEEDFHDNISIEEIQEKVIYKILENGYYSVAKDYIAYRERRSIARSTDINVNTTIAEYLDGCDMATKENSSTAFSLQGLNKHMFSSMSESYWLELLSPEIKTAYNRGRIHVHDLDVLGPYCEGWDLKELMIEGFKGVEGKPSSSPAKHFMSALNQSVNFVFTLQGEAAGAQAFSNFNTILAPFVRNDLLSYSQLKQAVQQFVFDMNISTRVGFQAPFSNITLDLDVTQTPMANDLVIIGGVPQSQTYREFQSEADMISKAILEVMLEGDAAGATHAYPILTFNVTEDFPWESELGDKILLLAAKYGSPYFANFINAENTDASSIRSMCCRLRLDSTEIQKFIQSEYSGGLDSEDYEHSHVKGGGFFGAAPKTGSIGVVTLGLPGIMHDMIKTGNKSWELFLDMVKEYMDLSMEALQKKRKQIELWADNGLYPYTKYYLRDIKQRTGHYFSQHFSTICPNGFHEALLVFGISEGMNSKEGQNYAIELIEYMKNYAIKLQTINRVLVNIEQSPAESAGVKLCRKSGVDPLKNGYYTNSTWFPADTNIDTFDQLTIQGEINKAYTGGSSVHSYTDTDLLPVYKSLKEYIIWAFTNTTIPYLTISPVYSICDKCGRIAGRHLKCPKCSSEKIYTQSRVVGYYRIENNFNDGRKKEALNREGHYIDSFEVK